MPDRVGPIAVTLVAVVPGLGAALCAATGRPILATVLWLVNRLLDGLDGTLARARGRQTDLGAYLDILMDFVVYAAVPIGLAVNADTTNTWIAAAVLLASFYVNTISWAYLSALLARRERETSGQFTSVTMPGGLIEGAETVVLYALMLAVPSFAPTLFLAMAAAVVITIGQRMVWATRHL